MPHPTFEHPVFEQLYTRDYFIDDAVLREILALGPEVAVPELLKLLDTTLRDFDTGELASTDWLDRYYFYHALYLLHDLHAPQLLDVLHRLLRLDADSTDYWFGDNIFEEVPELLARAAETRLPELLAMLQDPALTLQHRMVVSNALVLLVHEQPAQRPAILTFLQHYLRHAAAHAGQLPQLFPPDAETGNYGYKADSYLGALLADAQDAGLHELEPEMRELHRLGLVDESFAGGADDIDFDSHFRPRPALDIFARYQHLRDDPESDSPHHPDAAGIAQRRAEQEARFAQLRREQAARQFATPQPRQVPPKTGRNDPCPCGSGKKYKKCHGA